MGKCPLCTNIPRIIRSILSSLLHYRQPACHLKVEILTGVVSQQKQQPPLDLTSLFFSTLKSECYWCGAPLRIVMVNDFCSATILGEEEICSWIWKMKSEIEKQAMASSTPQIAVCAVSGVYKQIQRSWRNNQVIINLWMPNKSWSVEHDKNIFVLGCILLCLH